MKKIAQLISIISLLLTAAALPPEKITIYLIGDSTCADKPLDDNPERGWGQLFHNFMSDDVVLENHAKNGRSTKSFIDQGLWKVVYDKLKPGDYVLIQFGHNDSKISDTTRYAEAGTAYRKNLIFYIEQIRSKNAFPVLLTPVNRRKFDEKGKFVDQHGAYPAIVREVAAQHKVPLIDVHSKSMDYFSKLGEEGTKELFIMSVPPKAFKALPDGKNDNTHFTRKGAIVIAGMVADGIKENDLPISKFVKKDVDFSDEAKNKVVALDYFFNREFKKTAKGDSIQFHYIWEDKENSGFYKLGNLIENFGATLYEIHSAPTVNELKNSSVYIIVDPDTPKETARPNYIDEKSINEIEKWVEQGGVLVLMANDAGNCEFENLNKLSERFGIHFNEVSINRVTGTNWHIGKFDSFPDHPIFKNISQIYLKEISTFRLTGNAKPIFTNGEDIIMAGAEFGKGFVFAVGDPWIYNEYIDHRKLPVEFKNYECAQNLFEWLLSLAKPVKNL